ncbi:hypothetical protein JCM16303_000422 [Sporobolomyces ruberrimus]
MGSDVSTVPHDAPQAVHELEHYLQVAKFTSVSALSIAAYDHLACLDEEIEMIWRARHSVFKYLALVSRYSGLYVATIIVMTRLGDWDRHTCQRFLPVQVLAGDLAILSSTYVLALRTAAVYSFRRGICIVIVLLVLVQTTLALWASTKWEVLKLPPGISGCFPRPGINRPLSVSLYWAPSLLTNLVLLTLTLTRVFPIWSLATGSRLSWVLLRDEILYYSLISTMVVATNVLMYQKNQALGPILAPFTIVLSFHLTLNLRGISVNPIRTSEEQPVPMEEILARTCYPAPASHGPEIAVSSQDYRATIARRGPTDDEQLPERGAGADAGDPRKQLISKAEVLTSLEAARHLELPRERNEGEEA